MGTDGYAEKSLGTKSMSCVGKRQPVPKQVEVFLSANYPACYYPAHIATELGLSIVNVRKACQRLLKSGKIQRPSYQKKDWYQGIPTRYNLGNLEQPVVKIHSLTFFAEVQEKIKQDKTGATPPSLYTRQDNLTLNASEPVQDYWECNNHSYPVTFQFSAESITIHLNSSKKPLDEVEFIALKTWLYGILQGLGVNTRIISIKLVKAELNKDFELITITPTMLEIRDLENHSWLRIYRKYRNLHRLEIGTTWEGDKKLYELFKQFGSKSEVKEMSKLDEVMFS